MNRYYVEVYEAGELVAKLPIMAVDEDVALRLQEELFPNYDDNAFYYELM